MEELVKLVFVEDDSYRFLCKIFRVVNVVQVAVLVFVVICVDFSDSSVWL